MRGPAYYMINGITLYRLVTAPLLVIFIFTGNIDAFKWLLPISFFTDAIDGFLARRYKVASVLGAQLDSVADDLTLVAAVLGAFVFKRDFIVGEVEIILSLFALLVAQIVLALYKYRRMTSFHTYLAKLSAFLQGCFFILLFLLPGPLYILFYIAAVTTALELIEEIILVILLPGWKINVKGLYWALKEKKESGGRGV